MTLKYDATKHVASGYANDKPIGSLEFERRGDLCFVVAASTIKKGNDMDVTFDHPTLAIAGNAGGAQEKLP
jgi:hypothetical protein